MLSEVSAIGSSETSVELVSGKDVSTISYDSVPLQPIVDTAIRIVIVNINSDVIVSTNLFILEPPLSQVFHYYFYLLIT